MVDVSEDDYNLPRTEDIRTIRHSNKPTSPASQVVSSLPLKNTARAAKKCEVLAVLATLIILTFSGWTYPVIISSETEVSNIWQDSSTCSVWIIDCYSFFKITPNERELFLHLQGMATLYNFNIVHSIYILSSKQHQTGAERSLYIIQLNKLNF